MAKKPMTEVIEGEATLSQEKQETVQKRGVIGQFIWLLWRIVKAPFTLLFWPFRGLYHKWYGPTPLMFGAPPVDHSEPDFDKVDNDGMLKGQIVFFMITGFFIIAFFCIVLFLALI